MEATPDPGIMRSVAPPKSRRILRSCRITPHNHGLRIIGQSREDPEHRLTGGGRGIDRGALAGQHPEANAPLRQIVDHVDQVAEVTAESVELPHNQSVTRSKRLET